MRKLILVLAALLLLLPGSAFAEPQEQLILRQIDVGSFDVWQHIRHRRKVILFFLGDSVPGGEKCRQDFGGTDNARQASAKRRETLHESVQGEGRALK